MASVVACCAVLYIFALEDVLSREFVFRALGTFHSDILPIEMSVYGGFGTRLQETAYNQLLEALLRLLQDCILTNLHQVKLNSFWSRRFLEIFYELTRLESSKYQPPKLSLAVKDLADKLSLVPKHMPLPELSATPLYDKNQSFSARSLTPSPAPFPSKALTPTLARLPPRPLSLKDRSKRRNGLKERHRKAENLPRGELEWLPSRELSQHYYSRIMLKRLRFTKAEAFSRYPRMPNS